MGLTHRPRGPIAQGHYSRTVCVNFPTSESTQDLAVMSVTIVIFIRSHDHATHPQPSFGVVRSAYSSA